MHIHVMRSALALAVVCSSLAPVLGGERAADPRGWLAAGLRAMGGEQRVRGLRSLHLEATGRRTALEQSERPEGPWIDEYRHVVEDRDVQNARLRRTTAASFASYEYSQTVVVSDGAVAFDAGGGRMVPYAPGAEEWLAFGPERVLLTALEAADLAAGADVVLQGVPHHAVGFTWRGAPVRLYLNANTSLPTAVEITRPYAYDYFGVWGDVTTRTLYSAWMLQPGGLRYPMQWDVEQNGVLSTSTFLTKVQVDAPLPADAFAIPDDVRAAYTARAEAHGADVRLGRPDAPPAEIAPGVVQIPGAFNTAIVRQEDGLVVVEAPVSSAYSAKVLDEAARRFPGARVKAVVTTSDAWPHIGGLREYVARGIPVYLLDANVPIVTRVLAAPFRTWSDALARAPKKPDFRVVSAKTVVGSGEDRIEIYPIRTETGERQMMVYLPGRRLLYASDLAQPASGAGPWAPEYYDELRTAVAREGLAVDTVFAMHMTPVAWSELTSLVERTEAGGSKQ